MVGEAQERKLYNAASKGDVTTIVQLVEEDPYLVHEFSFPCSRNLLHIAAMHGQTPIVEKVLSLNPQLARSSDSQKSTPLHIAAAGGHVEIAMRLLSAAPEMCWWRDEQGMNPVHVAAMNGHVEIVEYLLLESCLPAMERLHRGQTVLHLCVKHSQIRVLVEKLGELVCAKDDDGETLLHLAARCNQLEVYGHMVRANTTAFVSSLITIFLVTTGFPATHFFFMVVALYAMWVALMAIAISYMMSVDVITLNHRVHSVGNVIMMVVAGALNMFGWVLVYVAVRHLYRSWKNKKRRQQELGGDAFIRCVFYWIFHQLETGGFQEPAVD